MLSACLQRITLVIEKSPPQSIKLITNLLVMRAVNNSKNNVMTVIIIKIVRKKII